MEESVKNVLFLLLVIGLPLGVWAQVSLMREMERRIKRCGSCTVCRAKQEEEERIEKEGRFRNQNLCVRGHGFMKEGRCATCGWS